MFVLHRLHGEAAEVEKGRQGVGGSGFRWEGEAWPEGGVCAAGAREGVG